MGRAKDQWIEKTGGFRFGETRDDFLSRVQKIQEIEDLISNGTATVEDIERLRSLKDIEVC